jgi:hypothetical protein
VEPHAAAVVDVTAADCVKAHMALARVLWVCSFQAEVAMSKRMARWLVFLKQVGIVPSLPLSCELVANWRKLVYNWLQTGGLTSP